jgi:phosphate starvation-inducible PhoH-like protein
LKTAQQHLEFTAPREDNARLANLCGPLDENLRQIEQALDVTMHAPRPPHHDPRARRETRADRARELLQQRARTAVGRRHPARARRSASSGTASSERQQWRHETPATRAIAGNPDHPFDQPADAAIDDDLEELGRSCTRGAPTCAAARRCPARISEADRLAHDVTFGIGPAGTGKTYLAVACAVDALERDQVKRIVLTRPAVEAGERLGFLPGDLKQKVDPYLRPLYDALYDLLGFDKTAKMFERQMIEIAPLAYMRGRTLNHAFIILDEAQNTTPEQMKMFLTRIGFGSKAVVTGDTTQVDLPRGHKSGLIEAQQVLRTCAASR